MVPLDAVAGEAGDHLQRKNRGGRGEAVGRERVGKGEGRQRGGRKMGSERREKERARFNSALTKKMT